MREEPGIEWWSTFPLPNKGDYSQINYLRPLCCHAPMLSERWQRMEADEFGGDWFYDITERFGREWAEELFNKTGVSLESQLESIIDDEMEK